MYSKLLATTAILALLAGTMPAAAQTADTSEAVQPTENVGTGQEAAQSENATVETDVAAEQAGPAQGILQTQSEGQTLTEDIIGADVRNAEDESIGEITGLVLGDEMQVVGALVSVGGFLGIGDKTVGVGWTDLTEAVDGFTVQISTEQLENAEPYTTLAEQESLAEAEAVRQQMLKNQQEAVPQEPVPAPAN